MLILKMWALGDSSQSMRAVDPDHSRKIGGLKKKRPSTQKMHHSRKIGNGAWGDRVSVVGVLAGELRDEGDEKEKI